ncbi:MAG: O-methyltransferase [Bacteroidota bacterium]
MREPRHAALQWVRHWLLSVGPYSIHSPLLYRFVNEALFKADNRMEVVAEDFRNQFIRNQRPISSFDSGSGASVKSARTLADVVKHEVAGQRLASIFRRIIEFQQASRVLEVGTSVGITTLWLSANPAVEVVTLEANPDLVEIAQEAFKNAGRNNIRLIPGNADETLSSLLNQGWVPDVAIMDANHRFGPTMNYFRHLAEAMNDNGIIILDDIHYSREMTEAWREVCAAPRVTLALDCFRFGIVFFDRNLTKETVPIDVPLNLLLS